MKRQIQQQSILCSYLYNNRKKTKKFLCFKEVFKKNNKNTIYLYESQKRILTNQLK